MREAGDERAQRRVLDERRQLADERQAGREVPVELAVDGGVIESGQRGVELRHLAAEILQQLGRVVGHRSQGHAVEPRQQPDEMPDSRGGRDLGDGGAVDARHEPRAERRPPRHVRERGVLGFQEIARVGRVGDLQHEAVTRGGPQGEVLIALAREGGGLGVHAVEAPGQVRGLGRRQRRGVMQHVHWDYDYPRYGARASIASVPASWIERR